MARFSVNISIELYEVLKVESKRRGLSVASIVREVLLKHYEHQLGTSSQLEALNDRLPEKSFVSPSVQVDNRDRR